MTHADAGDDSSRRALRRVKVLHTVIWAFFAACIVAVPITAATGHLAGAWVLIALVAVEVIVLLLNGMRCPLTGVAARYTAERQDNFDIYLPLWLARHNKRLFGALYVAGVLYTLLRGRGGLA